MRNFIILTFSFVLVLSCSKHKTYKFQRNISDTVFSMTIIEEDSVSPKKIDTAAEKVFAEAERVFNMFNYKSIDSETAKINTEIQTGRKGEKVDLKVSPEFYNLVSSSFSVSEKTGWVFDLSFKILSELWDKNLRATNPRLPSQAEINEAMLYVGKNSFELKGNNTIRFRRGTKIGFGGIIKGYAMERAALILKEEGLNSYIIEAGGDITISGNKSNKPWNAVLLNPSDDKKNFGYCLVKDETISIFTSGNFYSYAEFNGKRYSQTIDMRTGRPAESDLLNITVLNKDAKITDALATSLYVFGFKRIEQQFEIFDKEGIGVIIVDSNGIKKMNSTAMKFCYLTE